MDEFATRLAAAKKDRRGVVENDGYDVYKYCFNGREDEWVRKGKKSPTDEPDEIFADIVADVAEDFYGDLFHTMMPENAPWVEYEAGVAVGEDDVGAVEDLIREREIGIAKALKASNLYDEGPTSFQDAVFGTVGIWMDRFHINGPIVFESVPCSEMYLRLGPFGIDDRFRVQKYYYRDLPVLFPDADFPREIERKIKESKGSADVVRGFWQTFEDPGNPVWVSRTRVDGKDIGLDEDLGPIGAVPLQIGRFNAVPKSPWGRGPARRMLPRLSVLDELTRMNLESMDHTLDPSIIYAHDGIIDLSEGLESGIAYPAMPGTAESIREIGGGQLDYGFFAEERIEERIRDGFYRDITQKGKTPPSASQYMGEEQKQVRRMARPSGKLWKELGVGILMRAEWLETQPGGMFQENPQITLDGNIITIRPVSPLERAQAREEVLVAQSILGMTQESLGPEQAAMVIDGPATMTNIKEKLKDKLVTFRTEKQIMEIATAMQQQQQQQQGGANEGQVS